MQLTDVTSGGSTVFPDIGISVKPEKGAALVWYNLLRNGEGDRRTLHAACPVISGIKWGQTTIDTIRPLANATIEITS